MNDLEYHRFLKIKIVVLVYVLTSSTDIFRQFVLQREVAHLLRYYTPHGCLVVVSNPYSTWYQTYLLFSFFFIHCSLLKPSKDIVAYTKPNIFLKVSRALTRLSAAFRFSYINSSRELSKKHPVELFLVLEWNVHSSSLIVPQYLRVLGVYGRISCSDALVGVNLLCLCASQS